MIFHTNHPWTDSPHPICATFQGAPRSSKACSQRLHFSQADMALLKPRSRKAMRKWRPFHGHFMGIGLMEKNKSINQYIYIYILCMYYVYICVCVYIFGDMLSIDPALPTSQLPGWVHRKFDPDGTSGRFQLDFPKDPPIFWSKFGVSHGFPIIG